MVGLFNPKDATLGAALPLTRKQALMALSDMENKEAQKHYEAFVQAAEAMRQHAGDLEIQRWGCFALAHGAVGNVGWVLKAGGLECAIAAMSRFPQDERLCQEACETIRYMTVKENDTRKVIKSGGLRAVVTAMAVNSEAQWVQQEGVGVLKNVAKRHPQLVLDNGGLESVMRVMEMCPRHSWAQMWGITAFKRLAEAGHAKRVDGVLGFDQIASAMEAHEKSAPVQLFGNEALGIKDCSSAMEAFVVSKKPGFGQPPVAALGSAGS